jgi:hypothetical protein
MNILTDFDPIEPKMTRLSSKLDLREILDSGRIRVHSAKLFPSSKAPRQRDKRVG